MPNSDFLNQLTQWLQQHGCENYRITTPKKNRTDHVDIVVTGAGLSEALAAELAQKAFVGDVQYVPKIRALNICFEEAALFGAIAKWCNEPRPSCCALAPDREDKSWDNPFYVVQYAHHRAGNVARDRFNWDYAPDLARQLAVAVLLFQYGADDCKEPWPYMERLQDFAHVYARWHESLLHRRAEKIRTASMAAANGQIVQKEAIQHPISSALLARSAAITLQNGLRMLTIEPTKEWVE